MNGECLPDSKAIIVTSSKELLQTQKSKYIPTNITSLLPQIKQIDGKIAMVGLSCHIHGLENLLKINKKLKDKVIKIGLICERVMLHSAIDFLTKKTTNEEVVDFLYKDPTHTKYPGDSSATTKNGKTYFLDRKYRKTMKNYFTPARCYLCFDKMNIYADIVVGDPHGFNDIDKEDGESLVISRTLFGEQRYDKG